jgi:hypothetical protein
MKTPMEIYDTVIKVLHPFAFTSQSSRKPNIRDYKLLTERLAALIMGMIMGADLSGDKIDRLAKQIKKLVKLS